MTERLAPATGSYAREERRVLTICAGLIFACYGIDLLSADRAHEWLFAIRLGWALGVLGAASVHERLSLRTRRISLFGIASSAPLLLYAIAAIGAPLPNPLFYWAVVFPLVVTVVVRDDVMIVVANAVTTIAGGAAVLVITGHPLSAAAVFAMLTGCSGALAVFGSLHLGRLREAQSRADASRIDALERLADSERRRSDAERLALVGQLSAGVAHEINNPLAFALSNVRYLQESEAGAGDRAAALADVAMGLERIARIVQDLKNFARRDEASIEDADLREVLDESVRLASLRLRGIATVETRTVGPPLPAVRTDPKRICQVLVNLLVNAADALEGAGKGPGRVRVTLTAERDRVLAVVEDSGPGIPPSVMERLFEPLFTTKPPGKGTGLGLALSRDYVTQLGGTLTAGNGELGGARFEVRLPLPPALASGARGELAA